MKLNTKYLKNFINNKELEPIKEEVSRAHEMLEKRSGLGSDFLGWVDLPSSTTRSELNKIEDIASEIRENADVLIVIGIGGSYLGSRAAIEFLYPDYRNNKPLIVYAGNSIDPMYHKMVLDNVKGKDIYVNVISKSGTTIEPAASFRIITEYTKKIYTKAELKKRIICTTTKGKGALDAMAKKESWRCFYIPENVGGRFSVLTAVGLLPMAAAGIDIREIIKGAANMEKRASNPDFNKNVSYQYAALRNLLYRNGKNIEIISSFHTCFANMMEWWKQLFAESEGKEGRGIFPAVAVFSTDLHSIGQLIQEGERNIFETFLRIRKKESDVKLPFVKDNTDKLNYLAGKGLDFINNMAYEGTALAHYDGGIPNMSLTIDERSARCLGELIYFFQRAVGVSGYLLRINPFDQPGVEAYKKNMFRLLKRP